MFEFLLHTFSATYGSGEQNCVLHADNCAGQNKNRTVVSYVVWRILAGLHKEIHLSFMMAGHVRCLVDGCFRLVKSRYRRCDTFTLPQLVDIVNTSATCNVAHLGTVTWHQCDSFPDQNFKKVPAVSKYQHFTFSSASHVLRTSKRGWTPKPTESPFRRVILPYSPRCHCHPLLLVATCLKMARSIYIKKSVCSFVADPYQDELCPPLP